MKGHSELQEEVKNERVAHQRTRLGVREKEEEEREEKEERGRGKGEGSGEGEAMFRSSAVAYKTD